MACEYTYNGSVYSENEFKAVLLNEGYGQQNKELVPAAFKMTRAEFIAKNKDKFSSEKEAGEFWDRSRGDIRGSSAEKEYFIINSANSNAGLVPISPIYGKKPKPLNKMVLDLSLGIGKKLLYSISPSRRRALGSYNPTNTALKIKYRNDLTTIAHETGHWLDDKFGLLKNMPTDMEKELMPFSKYGSKPPQGHSNPKMYELGEGVAEFIKSYIINPEGAIEKAPLFYERYQQLVPDKIQKGINDFSNDVRVFAGSTNTDMLRANFDFDASKKKNSIIEFFKPRAATNEGFELGWYDRLGQKWWDTLRPWNAAIRYLIDVKEFETGEKVLPKNNPEILARLILGVNEKLDNIFNNGLVNGKLDRIVDKKTGQNMTVKWLIEPFNDTDEHTIREEMQLTSTYLVAERVNELYERFKKENEEAEAKGLPAPHSNIERIVNAGGGIYQNMGVVHGALDEFDELEQQYPEKHARIKEAARRLQAYADNVLKYMVDKGRLSQEQYDTIKANNMQYVGMGRIMEGNPDEEIIMYKNGGGSLNSVATFEKVQGSERMLKDPYEFLLDTTYKSIKEADRNEVMLAFADLLNSTRQMYEGDTNAISTIGRQSVQGEKNSISVFREGKKETYQLQPDIYASISGTQAAMTLPLAATLLPSILRWSVTTFPTFAVRNRVRDLQARLTMNDAGFSLSDFTHRKEAKEKYALYGAGQAGYYLLNKDFYYRTLREKTIELSKDKNVIVLSAKKLAKGYSAFLSGSERATRIEQYKASYRKAKAQGLDDYDANLIGAYNARDLLDFAVAGEYIKVLNQVIPFLNARIQGQRKLVKSIKKDPAGFALRTLLFNIIPSILVLELAAGDDDDDWYRQLPAWRRDMYYNIKLGDDTILAIPKPYEIGVIGSMFERLWDRTVHGNEKAFEGHAGSLATSFLPFDETTLAGPYSTAIEVYANKDFFRKQNIVPTYEEKKKLELREGTKYASKLGQSLQEAFGIDARYIDFAIKDMFSYPGDLVLKLSNIGEEDKKNIDLSTTGFIKNDAGPQSLDVQWVLNAADKYGISGLPFYAKNPLVNNYRALKNMLKSYYAAKTDFDKQQLSDTLRDMANKMRTEWEKELPEYEKNLKKDMTK